MDELVSEYVDILQRIYDERKAGDYTFHGVLYEFATQVKSELAKQERIPRPKGWLVKE